MSDIHVDSLEQLNYCNDILTDYKPKRCLVTLRLKELGEGQFTTEPDKEFHNGITLIKKDDRWARVCTKGLKSERLIVTGCLMKVSGGMMWRGC